MTHKQIWAGVAEAFYLPENEKTEKQKTVALCGLCWAGHKLGANNAYDICDILPGKRIIWLPMRHSIGHRREYDLMRGDMATLFSCMTKKEFNLLPAPKVPTND